MQRTRWIGAGVLASALVLTSCTSGPAGVDAKQNSKAPLELWTRTTPGGPGEQGALKLAAAFEKSTGFKVKVTAIFDDFETKLQQRAAQKKLPDIVMNDVTQLGAMHSQGLLREIDLDKLKNSQQIVGQGLDSGKSVDGKQFGLPYSAQASALLIRKDWREKLKLEVPQSWDDFAAMADAFTTKDPDGDGKKNTYGLAAPLSTKRGYASWYFSNFLWAAGGDFITGAGEGKYKPSMTTKESVQAVQWFRDLGCKSKVIQPGAVTMETPPTNETFEAGRTGMFVVGPYLLPRFDETLGKDKYEVVPMPKGPKDATVLAEGGSIYLMAGSENMAGQDAFADFAISVEGQKTGMAGETGFTVQLPVNKTVDISQVRPDPRWKTYADIYRSTGRYAPSIPNWTPVRQTTAETVNALLADCDLDTGTKLKELDKQLADILKEQGIAAS
ncbi:sugar ABC transporter substrate-binding protein [Streptomyces sp. NBC_00825]|uniref:sugar ABC transporter substrate-binding protein n=1 Tax=unclassified Streptomyces TaxID=2593676 RepID=UPI00224DB594|nr:MULTISPECIES: sugar ABC transporter substrate-binding protein [unclassified Streptomyces]WTB58730.1 sugar ABC transporter substrate-binding protein [Streptomyces sp. NBC_00826]WTH88393.1 sugar ABC transporter substrate-binding protein [Streptomyces sp. NBC_00825]WTH97122.1 sugar ABC transporter substrate-binding protein [Streptomyces sp. NBC_00822]MCX4862613.1 sugar ABC transporter substrate-binding protein [Streptomyces sp. NBC_00906]MCX4893850.1 sugar ABC transporter substrate-binding pro